MYAYKSFTHTMQLINFNIFIRIHAHGNVYIYI